MILDEGIELVEQAASNFHRAEFALQQSDRCASELYFRAAEISEFSHLEFKTSDLLGVAGAGECILQPDSRSLNDSVLFLAVDSLLPDSLTQRGPRLGLTGLVLGDCAAAERASSALGLQCTASQHRGQG